MERPILGRYILEVIITGSSSITINSTSVLYEAYQGGNIYNGNANFTCAGASNFYLCYDNKSTFNGNVSFNRTVAGSSYIFNAGAVAITGNFSYTNNIGGSTSINPSNSLVNIGGTINISSNPLSGNPTFFIYSVKNQTTGGTINIQNPGQVQITNDTLMLSTFNVIGYASASVSDFLQNVFSCNVTITEGALHTGSTYFRKNTINGNTIYNLNSSSALYEGYQGGDIYNGTSTFNLSGTGLFYLCYDNKSTFNGNLSVIRTGIGPSYIFNAGANGVTGNFSCTNNVGGLLSLNQSSAAFAPITGMINISFNPTGHPSFTMNKIFNQTSGGTISVQNPGQVLLANDTLQVAALNVNGTLSASISDYLQNSITGTINISDSIGNGTTYFRGNTINGNTTYSQNSTSKLYEAYQAADNFNGNLTIVRNAGTVQMAYTNNIFLQQDLTLNSAAGIVFGAPVRFSGSNSGTVRQLGIQPIMIPTLIMEKTGGAKITLNDSITITNTATFTSGNIYTGVNSNLIFPQNISYSNASTSSHVVGPVTKFGDNAFTFPVGSPVSYNPVAMSAPVGATTEFKAEYKYQNPTIDGFSTSSKAGTLTNISNAGYWDVQRLVGSTNVTLTCSFLTNPYEQYPVLANLKVAHWNGTQWDDLGNGGTTGTSANGTVVNAVPITSFSPFTIAGVTPTYFFTYGNPGPGPDGSPLKFGGVGGYPPYTVKQLPGGSYTSDSIFLVPNASITGFRLKDSLGVQRDTTITAPTAPTMYAVANGNGTVNFKGWRYFVYMTDASNKIMAAIKDNNLTLGNVTMNTYFASGNVATSPNGNLYLKRSFKIVSQLSPVGTRRVRFYITKQEFNDLQAADPTSLPTINSLTITKYTGPQEDSLFNPIPGGNAVIIPNSAITIADLGTLYSLDVDLSSFSSFYIGGNQSNLNLCPGSTISLSSNIIGATYQWQLDTGSGFNNISDAGVYTGTSTNSITISNIPGTHYGYKYRCVVNGGSFSQIYTLKFAMIWQGTVSNVWENAANWSCGLPDANTDVIINAGKPNYPQVGSNYSIRTLKLSPGTSVTVKTGFTLSVTK